jgi:predicted NAD/FAD-binding protein
LNDDDFTNRPLNIAVIGTGIAGMSAAWLLIKAHRVTVYEQHDRIGGHSNTVDVATGEGTTPVDTGFIVYNERNYPNLTAMLDHLDVPTKESEMSFGASLDRGGFEYSGTGLNGILGQRRNLFRPRFWRMIRDIFSFYRAAPEILNDPLTDDISIGDYLCQKKYTDSFINDHLLPMGAAIWSTTAAEMKEYPAKAFVRFFESHGLLTLNDRPQWRTVDGGSREYVRRLTAAYRDRIVLNGVRAVRRMANEAVVEDMAGNVTAYDHVVVATHADEAAALLSDSDERESGLLGRWRYTSNRAVLHRDASLMPKRRRVWSSWNFIGDPDEGGENRLCVTYWMNHLQSLEMDEPLFLTLNPVREPTDGSIVGEFDYAHPLFDSDALATQPGLWSLQGYRRTWYCGSYFGYGFHEDALQSGLAVGEHLGGVSRPWNVSGMNDRLHLGGSFREHVA